MLGHAEEASCDVAAIGDCRADVKSAIVGLIYTFIVMEY